MPGIFFTGPEGRIEARYSQSEQRAAPLALLMHPHPLHGGTMNNKVLYEMYHAFVRQGFSVLRFNFRGVGKSQGRFDNGIGELADAAAALNWLQTNNPHSNNVWVAGFSFGAWIAMQLLMRRPEVEHFVAISPPANKYDFSFLAPCPAPGLILQGDADSVVPEEAVLSLVEKLLKQKNSDIDYRVVAKADHFFRDKLPMMSEHMEDYIASRLNDDRPRNRVRNDKRRRHSSD